jgi:hypothetical protein
MWTNREKRATFKADRKAEKRPKREETGKTKNKTSLCAASTWVIWSGVWSPSVLIAWNKWYNYQTTLVIQCCKFDRRVREEGKHKIAWEHMCVCVTVSL